jgi:hypothetical protein
MTRGANLTKVYAKVFGLRECKTFRLPLETRRNFPLRNLFTAPSASYTALSTFESPFRDAAQHGRYSG